jgi:hypothetical protein
MANEYIYDGKSGRIGKGYFVNLPRRNPRDKRPSMYLENQAGKRIYLWVTDVTASFEMGGSFAQSVRNRSWYPRNFTQPTISFTGVAPNSYQFNRLAEFVRGSQLRALRDQDGGGIIKLVMPSRGIDVKRGQKGRHQAYTMNGYIKNVARGAKRFENVPTWTFDFILAFSYQGLFKTNEATTRALMSWADVVKNPGFNSGFVTDPDKLTIQQKTGSGDSTALTDGLNNFESDSSAPLGGIPDELI